MLTPHWICFCDFNSYFASFVIMGLQNGLPRESLTPNPPPPHLPPLLPSLLPSPPPHTFHPTLGLG